MSGSDKFPVFLDPGTGVKMARLTRADAIQHHFHHSRRTVTSDGVHLLFYSYETRHPNLCCLNLESGDLRRLTYRKDICPLAGVITADDLAVLYPAEDSIWAVSVPDGKETVISRFPGWQVRNMSISPDGHYVCAVMAVEGRSRLVEVDLYSGGSRVLLDLPRNIGRVQYDPAGKMILFSADSGSVLFRVGRDGGEETVIYAQAPGEWLLGGTWLSTEEILVVKFHDGLYRMDLAGNSRAIFKGPVWHPCVNPDAGLVACDTHAPDMGIVLISMVTGQWKVLCYPRSSNKGRLWFEPFPGIAPLRGEDVSAGEGEREGTEETALGPDWTHPCPRFHPDGRHVIFGSDFSGATHIYCAAIPSEMLAELGAGAG